MSRALPDGTVTLLFTDVVGSTRLVTHYGDRYADLLAEHRKVLREAFDRWGGVEVDTQGDSFLVAFARASDALRAAEQAQAESPVPVRIGVHTGEPSRTAEGYVGLDLHIGARIAQAAHGGQVLLSAATREVAGVPVRDRGLHRLRDVEGPVRLFQLGDGDFPPPRAQPLDGIPTPPTPLIGRKKELAELRRLLVLDGARLVTVTGPGGIGKTRLATEVGLGVRDRFADGAQFVDLSALRDPAVVLPTIAGTLGVQGALEQRLRDREALLLLDNLEQVIDAAPALAGLLQACPQVRLLVTSREPLRVRGEHEYPLKLLPESPAVELFRQRATGVDPEFDAPYETVAEICRRVDCLPLAIELAAARVRTLTAAELLDRLQQRLPVLARGPRDLPARQRTLRATIEWSHELLDAGEQRLFASLAVFAGGFSLEAAERVCETDLDAIESLVDKNLVRRPGDRFTLLETIRELARERLDERDDADAVAHRHAEYFVALAEQADEEIEAAEAFESHPDEEWFALLALEHDNVRAALRYLIDTEQCELAFRLGFAVRSFWWRHDYHDEGARWLEEAMRCPVDVPADIRAKGLYAHGQLSFFAGRSDDAEPSYAALVELASENDRRWLAAGYGGLALVARSRGDIGRARELFQRVLEINKELDDRKGIYYSLHQLGDLARDAGDYELSADLLGQAVDEARRFGRSMALPNSLHSLGDLALECGELDRARELYGESLTLFEAFDSRSSIAYCLAGLASVAAAEGDRDHAGRLWGAVERIEDEMGHRLLEFERKRYERALGESDASFASGVAGGRLLSLDEAVAEALADRPVQPRSERA